MTLADKLASLFASGNLEDKGRIEYEGSVYQVAPYFAIAVDFPSSEPSVKCNDIMKPFLGAGLRKTAIKASKTASVGDCYSPFYRSVGLFQVNEAYYRLFPVEAEWFSYGSSVVSMIVARSSGGALIGMLAPLRYTQADVSSTVIPSDEELYPILAKATA